MRQRAPSGLLYATREATVTTGLMIGPTSTNADFLYYRRPHLGATAWAVLAEAGWNPFDGKVLPDPGRKISDGKAPDGKPPRGGTPPVRP